MVLSLRITNNQNIPIKPEMKNELWIYVYTINEAKEAIQDFLHLKQDSNEYNITTLILDLDYNLGEFNKNNSIELLNWIKAENLNTTNFIFRIHAVNSIERKNMLQVIRKNGWKEYPV